MIYKSDNYRKRISYSIERSVERIFGNGFAQSVPWIGCGALNWERDDPVT